MQAINEGGENCMADLILLLLILAVSFSGGGR